MVLGTWKGTWCTLWELLFSKPLIWYVKGFPQPQNKMKTQTHSQASRQIQPEPSSWGAALPPTHSCSYSEFKCHPHQEVVTWTSTCYPYLALSFPEARLIVSSRPVSCSFWKKLQGTLYYLASLAGQAPLWNILTSKGHWAAIKSVLRMEFSRQEYWSGLSCHTPWDLPGPGIKPRSCIAGRFFTLWATTGKPCDSRVASKAHWHYYDSAPPQCFRPL